MSVYLPFTFHVMIILIPIHLTPKMDAKEVAFLKAHAQNERYVYRSSNFVER